MRVKGEIIEIGTFRDGHFKMQDENGKEYTMFVVNTERWDMLYECLNRPITVEILASHQDSYLVRI